MINLGATSSLVIGIATVCSCLLIVVLGVESFLRSFLPERDQYHRLLKALHRAMTRGRSVLPLLRREALLRSYPLNERLAKAIKDLEEDPGRLPLEVLAKRRVLPVDARLTLEAVASQDVHLQVTCLAGLIEHHPPREAGIDIMRIASFYLFWAMLTAFILLFHSVVILPKWMWIMEEVGLPLHPFAELLKGMGSAECFSGTVIILVIIALVMTLLRWFCRYRRLQRGVLLLAGAERGLGEGRLAALLATTFRRPPPELTAAGAAGDFATLCRSCYCEAQDPLSLGRFIDRTRARLYRQGARAVLAVRILMPVALGLIVLVVGLAYFSSLASILRVLS